MSSEVLTTSILTIASIVAVIALINTVVPSINELSRSYSAISHEMGTEVKTDIDIIFISTQENNISLWVKNVGSSRIPLSYLGMSDIFITSSSNSWHPYFENASAPTWDYTLENGDGSTWDAGETIKTSIELDTLPSDTYNINFVLYNGVSGSDIFSK
ncbi:hypothetical protein [Methanococcoides burtonii]|uniref:Uncharacterized protein n=1 Tax=Methanococcoides burtonii (strain DSM 6242 / NBRC 107633 / OCM 468 / ACE-M) TaxID=259564 RepID=Q12YY2_METBU|nr:hypothetical protein [Methanococcoides burtonii]ABE51344.1 Hypothetical protein Mbur_0349 [Methanococcoides burtonii DSM 6242]